LARRDFTVNALALHLGERCPGVIDSQGGLNDICRGLVRTLHPNSFVDDPTRIIRAVRYEQRFGFQIEQETLGQLTAAVSKGRLGLLSGDRLRHELERILQEDRSAMALNRMADLGILPAIHPALGVAGFAKGRNSGQLKERLEAIESGCQVPSGQWSVASGVRLRSAPLTLSEVEGATGHRPPATDYRRIGYLAALVYPLTRGQVVAVSQRLNLPAAWARPLEEVVHLRDREGELAEAGLEGSHLARKLEGYSEAALRVACRLTASPVVSRRLRSYLGELSQLTPALGGLDLLAMGVPEGPEIGRILRQLKKSRQDGKVATEAEERRLVMHLTGQGS
jgi:tRNA nucleotidyltransferase (CCA-adding enzyme)